MNSFDKRFHAINARAKNEIIMEKSRKARHQIQEICLSALESAESLLKGVTVSFPRSIIWDEYNINIEQQFTEKLCELLQGKFDVIFLESVKDSDNNTCWKYYIFYHH